MKDWDLGFNLAGSLIGSESRVGRPVPLPELYFDSFSYPLHIVSSAGGIV